MRKIRPLALPALGLVLAGGCQTRITAEKSAERAHPIQAVKTIGGTPTVVTTGYMVTSGGWEATARSPLWANEQFAKLAASVNPDGTVMFGVDDYRRDLSTNAVAATEAMVTGACTLAEKVTAAIVTSGGSPASDAVRSLVAKFVASGGDAANADISCRDGNCTISDGRTTCTDGSCYER